MSFERYVCWTPTHAREAIAVDAATPSDAVFLATHHPAYITLRPIGETAEDGERLTEEAVQEMVLSAADDPFLLPVIGQSGAGKSHLVRWLKASLSHDDEHRHVVYIPKYETSLRGVIDEIIRGFRGPEFDDVRERVKEATDDLDESTAHVHLLNYLAASFETWEPAPDKSENFEYLEYLAGPTNMAALLMDRVFREPLLAEGGTIRRFVQQALHGKRAGDESEVLQFNPADLPTHAVSAAAAGQAARDFCRQLVGNARLRKLAAEQLTKFLQPAVRQLLGVNSQELGQLFQRVRELLLEEGKELVLLIEDFTVLQGIQRELLDALLVPAVHQGQDRFCRLRAVLAVTTGYLEALELDTVRTRMRSALDLDVKLDEIGEDQRRDFVGRYLNAARMGARTLDEARQQSADDDHTWIPNHCDSCPYSGECHEAFGIDSNGYGLYPFNAQALDRALISRLRRPDVQGRFDPRVVLKDVVEYTLGKHRAPLENGIFPSRGFREHFKNPDAPQIPPLVEQDIERRDPVNAARRVTLLTFWGGAPRQLMNLHPTIHNAFAIPELKAGLPPPGRTGPTPPPPPPPPRTEPLTEALNSLVRWRRGGSLTQVVRRELRNAIHGHIVERVDFEQLVAQPNEWIRPGGKFSADRVILDQEAGEVPEHVYLKIDPEPAESHAALAALLKYQHHGHWQFEDGARSYQVFCKVLEEWCAEVEGQVKERLKATNETLQPTVQSLLIGGAAFGLMSPDDLTDASLIESLFVLPPEQLDEEDGAWGELIQTSLAHGQGKVGTRAWLQDHLIRMIGTSKGRSNVQMLDAAALLRALRNAAASVDSIPATSGDGSDDAATRQLRRQIKLVPRAIAERREQLARWLQEFRNHVADDAEDPEAIVQAVLEPVAQAGRSVGVDPGNAYELLKELGREFIDSEPLALRDRIVAGLESFDSMSRLEQLVFLASVPAEALASGKRFISFSDAVLTDIEHRMKRQGGVGEGEIDSAIQELDEEVQLIQQALSQIAELTSGGEG